MKTKIMTTITILTISAGVLTAAGPVYAADNNQDLQKQVAELQKKVEELQGALENKNNPQPAPGVSAPRQTGAVWDPFAEMGRIRQEMNGLFQDSFARGLGQDVFGGGFFSPRSEIRDAKDHYVVTIDMPGMEKADINIEVKGQGLFISGEKKASNEEENKADNYYRQESSFGYFSQVVPLPADADSNKIDAEYDKGVLTVTIAKSDKQKDNGTQKIKIN